jgi:hypothetical protein
MLNEEIQTFYHGTKVDLKPGDLITPGYNSNFGSRKKAAYVYLTATLDAATWGVLLTPAVGAVLMSVSTIVVAINAQLLKRVEL